MTDGVTIQDEIKCVEREIKMRAHVYPRWIEQGRMTAEMANKEQTCMRAVLERLQMIEASQRLI